jgi:hypothetical protein
MAPDKRKGEQSIRDAAAEQLPPEGQERGAAGEDLDRREDEGWSQPESSAQKGEAQEPEE